MITVGRVAAIIAAPSVASCHERFSRGSTTHLATQSSLLTSLRLEGSFSRSEQMPDALEKANRSYSEPSGHAGKDEATKSALGPSRRSVRSRTTVRAEELKPQTSKHDVDLELIRHGYGRQVAWNQTLKILAWLLGGASGGLAIHVVDSILRR